MVPTQRVQSLRVRRERIAAEEAIKALVQIMGCGGYGGWELGKESGGENRIPDFRRGFAFEAKLADFELTFPDPMHEFDAGDRDRGAPKAQSKHWAQTKFDRSMVLFDQIVQIFRGSNFGPLAAPMFAEDFSGRPM